MTWADVSNEVFISTSTIKNMAKRPWGIELDGVIGLARWVGRTVESFAGGDGGPPPVPDSRASSGRFRRFSTSALYAALDEERKRRGMTWGEVAAEIWPSGPWGATQLQGLSHRSRSDIGRAH